MNPTQTRNKSEKMNKKQEIFPKKKQKRKITNREYEEINIVSKRTATRDLENIVKRDIVDQVETTGKGTNMFSKGSNGQ
jgi:predicted HTH transcriptional regulator